MTTHSPLIVSQTITDWYVQNARDLPWRHHGATAWGILVSEFMLQQTQVSRVIPRWTSWIERWPTPAALAAAPVQEAIIAWDRLGYPRRALWLHQTATLIVERHNGIVPDDVPELLELPGVGDYTARAVASFAYAKRHPVVDTNTRRVIARVRNGQADQSSPKLQKDLLAMEEYLPVDSTASQLANYAMMEFGAVVCTSKAPQCDACPIVKACAWAELGFPAFSGVKPKPQKQFQGSDRQARGSIMAVLRNGPGLLLSEEAILAGIEDRAQADRALASLLADGLVVQGAGGFRLP